MINFWPDDKNCCVCVSFDLDAEWVIMGEDRKTAGMPKRLSLGEYVWQSEAIPRILNILDEYQIKSTFFVPGVNATNHPDVIQNIANRGHEIACHGWEHESVFDLSREEEKKKLLQTITAIEKVTGKRPIGNRGAGDELSPNTHDLLWEVGLLYDSSLRGHDMPYRIPKPESDAKDGLVIVPSYYEMDDFHLFADYPGVPGYEARIQSPQTAYEIWTTAFDGYYKYGLCYTTMFHPQIIGKPGYIMLLDRLLSYMKKFPKVWYAKADQIAEYWIDRGFR